MQFLKRIKDSVVEAADKAIDLTKEGAELVWDKAGDSINFTVELTADGIEWVKNIDKLFIKECIVPGYLIPNSGDPNTFILHLDFDKFIEELNSGVLVRPVAKLYAGTTVIERRHLANILRVDFSKQLKETLGKEKELLKELQKLREEDMNNETEKKGSLINDALSLTIAAIIGIIISGNPILDLILLITAFIGGKDTLALFSSYIKQLISLVILHKKDKTELEKIEEKIKDKEKSFDEAVGNIEIEVHSKLAYLYKLMCELEHEENPYEPGVISAPDEPDVTSIVKVHLEQGDFENKYEPFVKLVLEEDE